LKVFAETVNEEILDRGEFNILLVILSGVRRSRTQSKDLQSLFITEAGHLFAPINNP
jgi:hypothetical protein